MGWLGLVVGVVLILTACGGMEDDTGASPNTTEPITTPTTNVDGCYRAADLAAKPDFVASLDGQEGCVEGLMQALIGSDPLKAELREGFGLVAGEMIAPGDAVGVDRQLGDPCDYVRLAGPMRSLAGGVAGRQLIIRPAKLTVLVPDAVEREPGGLCSEPEGRYRPPS